MRAGEVRSYDIAAIRVDVARSVYSLNRHRRGYCRMTIKTEKQKMLSGEAYRPGDPELAADAQRAREWMVHYNTTLAASPEERRKSLRELLAHVGEDAVIRPPFFCDYGQHISLGDGVFINFNCVILAVADIRYYVATSRTAPIQHPKVIPERAVFWSKRSEDSASKVCVCRKLGAVNDDRSRIADPCQSFGKVRTQRRGPSIAAVGADDPKRIPRYRCNKLIGHRAPHACKAPPIQTSRQH